MHIEIDKNKCVGSLPCTKIAPAVFRIGADGKAYILDDNADTEEKIILAAQTCPMNAIILKDKLGNQIFPPEK